MEDQDTKDQILLSMVCDLPRCGGIWAGFGLMTAASIGPRSHIWFTTAVRCWKWSLQVIKKVFEFELEMVSEPWKSYLILEVAQTKAGFQDQEWKRNIARIKRIKEAKLFSLQCCIIARGVSVGAIWCHSIAVLCNCEVSFCSIEWYCVSAAWFDGFPMICHNAKITWNIASYFFLQFSIFA